MSKRISPTTIIRPLLLSALLAAAGASQAAVVQINASWDLGTKQTSLIGGPVSIANGDHVVYNVDFAGNQALNIADGNESLNTWLMSGDNNSSFTINNVSLDLLGFVGAGGAASSYFSATQSGGMAHLGPVWNNFLTVGQSVSFSGFEVEYDVQSIAVSPHRYSNPWLFYSGDQVTVGIANDVPEPMSIALIGIGLAGLGFSRPKQVK